MAKDQSQYIDYIILLNNMSMLNNKIGGENMKEKIWNYIYQYKLWIVLGCSGFVLITALIICIPKGNGSVSLEPISQPQEKVEQPIKNTYKVDIKGAVAHPGVYEMEEEARVEDVILKSGGLTSDADTSVLNLSKSVKDEMVIIIYTKKELESMRKGNTTIKYIEKECICPKLENNACIEDKITNEKEITDSNESTTKPSGKISLNSASLKELTGLTGIGEKKAEAIIEYRNKNGGFKSIEEITKVSGIGASTFEKIKDQLTL